MKTQKLKINKACTENWNKMKPNIEGAFCTSCAKTVLDFTQLSQAEIFDKINKTKGEVCGRLTKSQLNTPFSKQTYSYDVNFPYGKVAAGAILVSSLWSCQYGMTNSNTNLSNPIVQSDNFKQNEHATDIETNSVVNENVKNNINFKGIVLESETNNPVGNVEISLVTLSKVYNCYSDSTGAFSLEIPEYIIDDANVISISYHKAFILDTVTRFFRFEDENLILPEEGFKNKHTIHAVQEIIMLGGIEVYDVNPPKPKVFCNGVEIRYSDFEKAQRGKSDSFNTDNKIHYYYHGTEAVAIAGEKARHGLYLYFDKTN